MKTEKKWYAVYTRPNWEKKISALLTKNNIENFCPLNKVVKQWADRKKTLYQPLFSCYVFVFVQDDEHLLVKKTDGILNFVHWLGKPAVIHNYEIDAIKDFLDIYENIKLEQIHVDISVNDKIKIIKGPLVYQEGNVLEVRNKTVKVQLPSLGYALVAEVSKSSIEIINHTHPNGEQLINQQLSKYQ